ncbi:WRKY transcription factor 44-like protein [Drosera capensis]
MEVKEADRVVIAKPVASRPSCSSYKSFSELLAGAISASPSSGAPCSEAAVAAIRPKTVRVKPAATRAPQGISSQAEASGTAPCSSYQKVYKPESNSNVVYKPLAKVVSKATVLLLASMVSDVLLVLIFSFVHLVWGTSNITHQQALAQVEARAEHLNLHPTMQPTTQPFPMVPLQGEVPQLTTPPQSVQQTVVEEDLKTSASLANVDRPSYDGYNWRKYGQKQVKGSEYPRSYYKCTHPNCPVKKKVERSLDGKIAEIVYKGEHNHPKPQPLKRSSSGQQGQGSVADAVTQDQDPNKTSKCNGTVSDANDGTEGQLEVQNEVGLTSQPTYSNVGQFRSLDHVAMGECNAGGGELENSCAVSADGEEGGKGLEVDEEEPKSKKRRKDNQNNDAGTSGDGIQESRQQVQSTVESEILGDGFRWRKYGQKVVKGNPYPRSYYRCTSLKCNVRKHVERASDDPRSLITTYEGKHNHEMPAKNTTSAASESDSQPPSVKEKK